MFRGIPLGTNTSTAPLSLEKEVIDSSESEGLVIRIIAPITGSCVWMSLSLRDTETFCECHWAIANAGTSNPATNPLDNNFGTIFQF